MLGFGVRWDQDSRTVFAEKAGVQITLQVDNTEAILNGDSTTLSVAPRNIEGSVFVPIRFVGEASSFEVSWDSATKTIFLMPPRPVVSVDGKSKITISGKWGHITKV
ncbi:copper amine oxidase N-terminal domain-containing protein [Paenibacillus agricola]